MKYGYARVSTIHQDLQIQLQQLEKENCDEIFSEESKILTFEKVDLINFHDIK